MEETAAFRHVKSRTRWRNCRCSNSSRIIAGRLHPPRIEISEIAYASIGGVFVMSYATANLDALALVLNGRSLNRCGAVCDPLSSAGCRIVSAAGDGFYSSACFRRCCVSRCSASPSTRDPTWSSPTIVVAITVGPRW